MNSVCGSRFWEVRVSKYQAGNKIVFGSLNSFFDGICLVAMWSHFHEATNMQ